MSDIHNLENKWWNSITLKPESVSGEAVENLAKTAFEAGYKAAKAESPWVPIVNIPEDWMDGRSLLARDGPDLFEVHVYGFDLDDDDDKLTVPMWGSHCGQWVTEKIEFTHVMLPPTPPESEG